MLKDLSVGGAQQTSGHVFHRAQSTKKFFDRNSFRRIQIKADMDRVAHQPAQPAAKPGVRPFDKNLARGKLAPSRIINLQPLPIREGIIRAGVTKIVAVRRSPPPTYGRKGGSGEFNFGSPTHARNENQANSIVMKSINRAMLPKI